MTARRVCGDGACSAAWRTYHFAKKPMPPAIGKPSSASMKTAIAIASHGRTEPQPRPSRRTSSGRSAPWLSAMSTANAPNVASVYANR